MMNVLKLLVRRVLQRHQIHAMFLSCIILSSNAFTMTAPFISSSQIARNSGILSASATASSSSSSSSSSPSSSSSLVVVSPPGGIGEAAAVRAASMGADVRWFVVSNDGQNKQVALSQYALDEIEAAGGNVELAGADAGSLLLPADDPNSAIQAVSTWCGAADSILCTFDGIEQALATTSAAKRKNEDVDPKVLWKNAVKVAAKEASSSISGMKIAVLSATEKEKSSDPDSEDSSEGGGLGGIVGNLLGGNRPSMPASLTSALSSSGSRNVMKLRHGELFGVPESSPDFSPLVGGPRRQPELCEEYTMRSVRVDPTLSVSGNLMMGSNTRSSRHAVGEAAALIATGTISSAAMNGLDVCISSQLGSDILPLELWEKEFQRVEKMLESGGSSSAPQLFSAEFSSVPDVERLADWLATKWAPAVLRTYDIAAIRIGARPVYATRSVGDGTVEIVWQQLVDFDSVTVGKMVIEVSDTGLVARRGPGDAAKGFGSTSSKPLAGEDVLVRRLAEAASQAIEKGLANKPTLARKPKEAPKAQPAEVATVTSIQSSGTVAAGAKPAETAAASSSDQGPRQAGARRSRERQRGTKRRKASTNKSSSK